MDVLKIDRNRVDSSALEAAVSVLRAGGVVAYPTESLYGLGVDPRISSAVDRLRSIKGRDPKRPIPVVVSDVAMLRRLVIVPDKALPLMENFCPGPLTLVLRPRAGEGEALCKALGGQGLGIRVPGLAWPREISKVLDFAVTATSANITNGPDAADAGELIGMLGRAMDLVLDAGPVGPGPPSTVLDMTGDDLLVLREGAIDMKSVKRIWGE